MGIRGVHRNPHKQVSFWRFSTPRRPDQAPTKVDLESLGKKVIFVEWQEYPRMSYNPSFVDRLMEEIGEQPVDDLYFICRSGVRSMEAAHVVSGHLSSVGKKIRCVNVAEGFEGTLNMEKHRGGHSGWKARNLAWYQY